MKKYILWMFKTCLLLNNLFGLFVLKSKEVNFDRYSQDRPHKDDNFDKKTSIFQFRYLRYNLN